MNQNREMQEVSTNRRRNKRKLLGEIVKMQVSIYSRKEIENLLQEGFPENTAVISFYDPPGKLGNRESAVDYKGRPDMLFQVAVNDIDLQVLGDYGLTFDTYFTEVEELAEFIHEAKRLGKDIICQCEYGQSRSAACAAAILEYFESNGISVFRDYRYYPNQLIFNKVYEALKCVKTNNKSDEHVTGRGF